MRRVAVDFEEAGQAVDQVVDGGSEVGGVVAAAPLVEKQAVAFVFLQRRGVEDAENVVVNSNGFDFVGAFSGGPPVERVNVLQYGENFFFGQLLAQRPGQVAGREMRLAEQHEDDGVGMALADFCNLRSGVTVTGADFAQIFAWHAVETVDGLGMVAGSDEQMVKWRPIVSPVEVEANALPEFGLVDFSAPPFVENVLVAGKNGFDA